MMKRYRAKIAYTKAHSIGSITIEQNTAPFEAEGWFDAREKAAVMLGVEPDHVEVEELPRVEASIVSLREIGFVMGTPSMRPVPPTTPKKPRKKTAKKARK